MEKQMNKSILIGRTVKDPELKYLPGKGTAVTSLTLAVDRNFKKEGQPDADFIPVVIFGKQAESTAKYVDKGKKIAISGRIQTRSYDAKDGSKRYVTEIIADEVEFLEWAEKRADIKKNIAHISELMDAAIWLSGIEMPVRLVTIPEGALQGFTDELFAWDHKYYVDNMAIEIPGEETRLLGKKAIEYNTYIIAQAKTLHPEFPGKFFNSAFLIDPKGDIYSLSLNPAFAIILL